MRNGSAKRINTKQQRDNTGLIFGVTIVLGILLPIYMLLVVHDSVFLTVVMTLGVWITGIVIAKPGKIAEQIYDNGFWRTIFGSGSNSGRGSRQRNRQRNNRNNRR
ncbi:hypothetical protein [Limosilactobacillus mucosae]|uniref:Uncharacterized protein n=1 Tax=Limosilactobacillus mucosae TaxID=97478 RepID=A0AAJ1HQ26_LIMMU|nr:hypothetical protein [Limosilactobacillus mucosae]MDC2828517.1 hypothetical protein [Limosilactobacillus mucosae]MDC2834529.1 hypothetical protein [Limosilactobacillus mucosae]